MIKSCNPYTSNPAQQNLGSFYWTTMMDWQYIIMWSQLNNIITHYIPIELIQLLSCVFIDPDLWMKSILNYGGPLGIPAFIHISVYICILMAIIMYTEFHFYKYHIIFAPALFILYGASTKGLNTWASKRTLLPWGQCLFPAWYSCYLCQEGNQLEHGEAFP